MDQFLQRLPPYQAAADGLLDLTDLARARTAAQTARMNAAPATPDATPLSQALHELRDEEGDR